MWQGKAFIPTVYRAGPWYKPAVPVESTQSPTERSAAPEESGAMTGTKNPGNPGASDKQRQKSENVSRWLGPSARPCAYVVIVFQLQRANMAAHVVACLPC